MRVTKLFADQLFTLLGIAASAPIGMPTWPVRNCVGPVPPVRAYIGPSTFIRNIPSISYIKDDTMTTYGLAHFSFSLFEALSDKTVVYLDWLLHYFGKKD